MNGKIGKNENFDLSPDLRVGVSEETLDHDEKSWKNLTPENRRTA